MDHPSYVLICAVHETTDCADRSVATGHGPCWMAPPFVTPLKQWIEALASTLIRDLIFCPPKLTAYDRHSILDMV